MEIDELKKIRFKRALKDLFNEQEWKILADIYFLDKGSGEQMLEKIVDRAYGKDGISIENIASLCNDFVVTIGGPVYPLGPSQKQFVKNLLDRLYDFVKTHKEPETEKEKPEAAAEIYRDGEKPPKGLAKIYDFRRPTEKK